MGILSASEAVALGAGVFGSNFLKEAYLLEMKLYVKIEILYFYNISLKVNSKNLFPVASGKFICGILLGQKNNEYRNFTKNFLMMNASPLLVPI